MCGNSLLGRHDDIDDDMAARLRTILSPAIAKPGIGRGAWRPWIDSLSEGASELRERAAPERYKHRRQRLTAFAELKAGATVGEAGSDSPRPAEERLPLARLRDQTGA